MTSLIPACRQMLSHLGGKDYTVGGKVLRTLGGECCDENVELAFQRTLLPLEVIDKSLKKRPERGRGKIPNLEHGQGKRKKMWFCRTEPACQQG